MAAARALEARKSSPVRILRVPVKVLTESDALELVDHLVTEPGPSVLAFANSHTLNLAHLDRRYAEVLRDADAVLRDGIGLGLAARLQGRRFPANLNGTDFTPKMLELAANRGWKVYLLGGVPGVAEQAATQLTETYLGLKVVGTHHGFFRAADELRVAREVRDSAADICMVALGNPLQEYFLARYIEEMGCSLGVGVGAFLDFASARVPRAPISLNRWGLEWAYRLAHEPRRLWRRYLVGNPLFLVRAARETIRVRRRPDERY